VATQARKSLMSFATYDGASAAPPVQGWRGRLVLVGGGAPVWGPCPFGSLLGRGGLPPPSLLVQPVASHGRVETC